MKKTFSKKTRRVNKRTRRRTNGGGLFSWLFNRKKEPSQEETRGPSQENIVPTYQEDTRGPYEENMAQRVQKNMGAKSDSFQADYDNDDDDDAKPINEAQNIDNVGDDDDGLTDVATLGGKRKSKRTIKRRRKSKRTIKRRK
jgi:hypothetical protein